MLADRMKYTNSEESIPEYIQEEEEYLLNKEALSEDEDWTAIVSDADEETLPQNLSIMRYICIGLSIGLVFLIMRLLMVYIGHMQPMPRPAEKLYFNGTDYFSSTVILISLSGFRPDYLNRNITPYLNSLANNGIRAEKMYPIFPPNTLPNHWTLITGLYPETHGIVDNSFYDPNMGVFEHKNETITSDRWWWKGEPIWLTSRMNRKKSASIMWPGSNTRYNTPDYIVPVSKSMKVKEQIQTVVEWLDLPYNTRPQMISVHVPQMEEKSHKEKPDSPKMDEHIKEVDDAIGYLTKEIFSRNLDPHAHIVIVSDHGMVSTSKYKLIYIDDILPHHLLEYVKNASPSSVLHFRPNISSNVVQEIYQQLIHHTKTSHFKVYLRENMPIRYHYKHSDRISPIQAIPNIGYQFVTHSMEFNEGGDHEGYDNLADAMGSIFLARGPKVSKIYKPGTVLEPFVNVEVYGFMTELLNINAAPNNGTVGTKFPILYEPPFPPK